MKHLVTIGCNEVNYYFSDDSSQRNSVPGLYVNAAGERLENEIWRNNAKKR